MILSPNIFVYYKYRMSRNSNGRFRMARSLCYTSAMDRVTRYAFIVTIGFIVAACGDDSPTGQGAPWTPPDPLGQFVEGTAWSLVDSMPLAGARAALVQGIPYEIVAGPVDTDDDGHFEFHNPPIGDYYLFLFTPDHLMQDAWDAQVHIEEGDTLSLDIAMIPSGLWDGDGARAQGIVSDADTGEPIAGAYVSSINGILFNPFMGIPLSAECVTDSTGYYSVELFTIVDENNYLIGTYVSASKEGYLPVSHFLGLIPQDTVPLDIVLARDTATGTIRGRVVVRGGPVSGVPVGIDCVEAPPVAAGKDNGDGPQLVPLLGKSTVSGVDGWFRITGLSAGSYTIECAFLPDDGYAIVAGSYGYPILSEGQTVNLGDMEVAVAIRPIYPEPGSVIQETLPEFRWEAHPRADFYRLWASVGHLMNSYTTNTNHWTSSFPIPPGTSIRWIVTAYEGTENYGIELSSFETTVSFSVSEP